MSPAFKRLFAIYGVIVAVTLIFARSAMDLAGLWTDLDSLEYTHGYMVAAVSLWLIFARRDELARETQRPSAWAMVAWCACAAAWTFFWRLEIRDAYLCLYPLLIWLALYSALGRRIALLLAFPIAYLYFSLPAWSWINPLLQWLSIYGVQILLTLTGIPMEVQGSLIHVPAGTFEIAPSCSGLHFFTTGLALAALLGELNRDPWRTRLKWLVLMGGLALLANWIRIVIIILSGQLTQMQTSLITAEHYRFGWAVFAVAVVLFFWIARRSERSASL